MLQNVFGLLMAQRVRVYVNPFVYQMTLPSGFIGYTWKGQLYIIRGSSVVISKNIVFISEKIDFVLANSADPDEMRQVPVYWFLVFKGLK